MVTLWYRNFGLILLVYSTHSTCVSCRQGLTLVRDFSSFVSSLLCRTSVSLQFYCLEESEISLSKQSNRYFITF